MSSPRTTPALAAFAATALLALAAPAAQAAPGSIGVGPDGTAYASDMDTSVITKIAPDGTVGASFGGRGTTPGTFAGIAGIDVEKDTGNVWVLDDTNRLQELTNTGTPLRSVNLGPCTETGDIYGRGGVSVQGQYVFTTSACNDTVVRLNTSDLAGRVQWTVNDGAGISWNPYASGGYNVAIAAGDERQVKLFKTDGTFVRNQPVGGVVTDVDLDDYSVVIANDLDAGLIHFYGSDGVQFRALGGQGSAAGKFDQPIDFDVFWQFGGELQGNLFVADYGNNRVQRLSNGGYTFYAKSIAGQTPGGGTGGGGTGGGGTGGGGTGGGAPAPTGRVGVSIAGGAAFVSSTGVTLNIVPPAGTTKVLISNDGGFASATELPYAASNTYTHTLQSAGAERLPKTVYVRFLGAGDDTKTFTDDVILDTTAPGLRSAVASGGAAVRAAKPLRTTTVRLKAVDATSGVKFAELATKPGGRSVTVRYAALVKAKGVGPRPYVRVIDAAGNRSGWKRATVKR